MKKNKEFGFDFDELGTIYNSLVSDIGEYKKKLLKSEIENMEKLEQKYPYLEEYKNNIYEITLMQVIDYKEVLKNKINMLIQNF